MNATLSETESEREMAAKQRQERVTEEASARQERKKSEHPKQQFEWITFILVLLLM
jgi:hypothetical protein